METNTYAAIGVFGRNRPAVGNEAPNRVDFSDDGTGGLTMNTTAAIAAAVLVVVSVHVIYVKLTPQHDYLFDISSRQVFPRRLARNNIPDEDCPALVGGPKNCSITTLERAS